MKLNKKASIATVAPYAIEVVLDYLYSEKMQAFVAMMVMTDVR